MSRQQLNSSIEDKLKATQKHMSRELLRLKQDVATRWNSTFYMLRRFIEIKDLITSTLTLTNASLPEEWKIAIEIVDIIDPFEKVITLYHLMMHVFLIF